MAIEIPNIVEVIAITVAALVVIGSKLNASRRDDNVTRRDDAETNLIKAQNDAATKFVQDLVEEHRRVISQLANAERERTNNAQRIGELTTEVNLLREQIVEVKNLLQKLTKDLEDARRKINESEGIIIRLEAERDAALSRLASREEECKTCKKAP
jgi:chromosome segregation ATPase